MWKFIHTYKNRTCDRHPACAWQLGGRVTDIVSSAALAVPASVTSSVWRPLSASHAFLIREPVQIGAGYYLGETGWSSSSDLFALPRLGTCQVAASVGKQRRGSRSVLTAFKIQHFRILLLPFSEWEITRSIPWYWPQSRISCWSQEAISLAQTQGMAPFKPWKYGQQHFQRSIPDILDLICLIWELKRN